MIEIDLGREFDCMDCSDLLWDYLCTKGEVKTISVSGIRISYEYQRRYTHPSFEKDDAQKARIWVANRLIKIARSVLDSK